MFNRKGKFNTPSKKADKVKMDGHVFDSKLELRYYQENLKPLVESHALKELVVHPRYLLQEAYKKKDRTVKAIYYEADFEVTFTEGDKLVIDIKGMPTPEAKLKRKLFERKYPDLYLKWLSYSKIDGGWVNYDDLIKARAKRKKEKTVKTHKEAKQSEN